MRAALTEVNCVNRTLIKAPDGTVRILSAESDYRYYRNVLVQFSMAVYRHGLPQ